jgi:hypothetical protein
MEVRTYRIIAELSSQYTAGVHTHRLFAIQSHYELGAIDFKWQQHRFNRQRQR